MSKRKINTKRVLSISMLAAMLFNVAMPQTLVHASTNPSKQSTSSGTFTAAEVNRILDGLTPEQRANINKLTGADDLQKIHLNQEDLRRPGNINVIVRFKEDPAKIQIIKQALANGGATLNSQAFAAEYKTAQTEVADSHADFKSFLNSQSKTQFIGGKQVSTGMRITREYTDAFNGVSLSLPANQIQKLAENPEVASIWSQVEYTVADGGSTTQTAVTSGSIGKPTTGLSLLGLDKLQAEGHTGIIKSGPRTGQKIKVGVLDTGIDYNHPDLKAVYKGGHDFVNNKGIDENGNVIYVDDHDPMETTYVDWKYAKDSPDPLVGPPPADYKQYITEHGSHVSGTIAANTTDNNSVYSANGVAPNVELYGYRVLGPGGRGTSDSVLNGIDQAVKDHMDVINLSLGASINDPMYPTSIAINNATLAGVVCAVAAGNAGPRKSTVGSPGTSALAITVGATTIPKSIPVMTIKNGSNSYQARLFGKNFAQADDAFKGQTFPIEDVGLGSAADYIGKDMKGKIALVHRGVDYLSTKMANAKNAGAAGMVIWDNQDDAANQGYISSDLGVGMDNIYAVSLTQAQGQALSDAVSKDPKNATITFPSTLDAPIIKGGDQLAGFSSTGPVKDWTIKPDVVAPGVDIMSTVPYDAYEPQDTATHDYKYSYMNMSGTSMATPHVAGIIALVLAAHPNYSPADVKTALMNTAKDINTDSTTYSVYQVGAGRVDPARAINADVKIQVLDKSNTYDNPGDSSTVRQVDNLTGSMFFGFKGRGDGATNGTDDVVSSKDFNVTNQGTSSKTFNVSTKFITTKFAGSIPVGSGTGNDVKIDFTSGGSNVTSINAGGGSAVKATATITVPSNALDGTYEGYIYLVNAADATESYRIPFTITVAEKGLNFKVLMKAFTLPEDVTGNWNEDTPNYASRFTFSVTSAMQNMYLVLKDKNGNYLGLVGYYNLSNWAPGTQSNPIMMLFMGGYWPFTKPYNGSLDPSGIADSRTLIKEGAYSVEAIATDADGKHYIAEDTVYVDTTAPTMTMDSDSKPGIYEIDPTGYQPGQEIKGFYGKVYDSNIDYMKNNGETSLVDSNGNPMPIDQSHNMVWGYQDSIWPTMTFNTDAKGRWHFGVTPEDVLNNPVGSEFRIYPSDYSGEADIHTGMLPYYFIKKGTPYVTWTSSRGVDAGPGNQDKLVVDANKPFKTTIATKYGMGMTGAKITLNDNFTYLFSNIRLSDEYKNYLSSKGIDPSTVLTVGQPYQDINMGGKSTDITISGIGAAGALDKDMNILEADVTYTSPDPIVGPFNVSIRPDKAILTLSGVDTQVGAFPTNVPYVRQSISQLRGRIAAEAFARDNVGNAFPPTTVDTGAKVTVTDSNGKTFITDTPTTTDNNTVDYKYISGYYAVTMDVSDKPYSVVTSMPGHFKGYATTPVIGNSHYGYQSGTVYALPNIIPILLGGDVNGDNVIDMKDLMAEINVYLNYKNLISINNPVPANLTAKTTFLNSNRNADIYWIKPGSFGYGIDYNDFYYLFKNFGKQNQSAMDAGITVPTPQLTVDQDTTITTQYGGTITLNAGDGLQQVMQKLNFAGPVQKSSATTLPTIQDLQKGSSITLVPTSTVFLDDVVWRKAITNILLDSNDVTNAVSISPGYQTRLVANPSQITLPGSLFTATGDHNYAVRIKATGYQDVTLSLTVKSTPIPTPAIPWVTDPSKAHIGQDLTVKFTDDPKWRLGIYKIVVRTTYTPNPQLDLSTLPNGSSFYDLSVPGQITFKADLFKTNATPVSPTSPINPGGTNWLPNLYKMTISSIGADGTVYPDVEVGGDKTYPARQAVGYGVTFNSQGGSTINPIAVGYKASQSPSDGPNSYLISRFTPRPTRSGYVFMGWYNEPECTTPWDASASLTSDITVYAKWQLSYIQNYSPVDKTKPNGLKFDGTGTDVSGLGWALGEGDLKLTIPDYQTNVAWLTDKTSISSITVQNDTATPYTIDPSTFDFISNADGSGTFTFKTTTEAYAAAHPNEKFAFSAPGSNYKVTVNSTTPGQNTQFTSIKLGYRRHIDLNGGTLKSLTDSFFYDALTTTGTATAPDMSVAYLHVANGNLSVSSKLYLDSANSPGMVSDISNSKSVRLTDNTTFYLCWIKTPPTVSNQTVGNTVGSDIKLTFKDDGIWKNNIKEVWIGSKKLVPNIDYTLSDSAITLNHYLFTAGQKVNVLIKSEGYADANVQGQVIGYLVTFESNGGDSIAPQIVDRNATKPGDPTKAGYKFVGWYTDQAFTNPFDFASIVTSPITLYAKYALAASLVTTDIRDNCLGNDMTLDFSDSDWAKAITGITINASSIDATKYKVNLATHTITLDKSHFTKAGDFAININATDYADVNVIQKVIKGSNVHFVLKDNAPFSIQDEIVARRITEPVVYGYDLTWFADEACTLPWVFTNSIYSDRTIYGKWTPHKFSVVFDHQDGGLVDSKTGEYSKTIAAPTAPTRPGYAFLGWYKDTAGKTAWNFATDKVTGDTILYAKWATGVENNGIYNKDVKITFNEATATLDGKAYTSGSAVSSEGNHALVVTDAAGNATTVTFTIDKTAPIVSGVLNNGSYNHSITLQFNEDNATLNGAPIVNNYTVSKEGDYTLVVTDAAGNSTTVKFSIDKTAPVVTGVNNNGLYKNDVTVTFNEGTATLDGDYITSGTVVNEEGKHTLIVTDQVGNVTTVKFTIDKTAPVVTGVSNNALYNHDVTVTFNEGTAVLNGEAVTSGTAVSKEGTNTIVVTDKAGNVTTVTFVIDKTSPVVTGVSNNGLYNRNVTLSFNEVSALLNGKQIANGTVVTKDGIYTLVVRDLAANVTTVKFTIDKTAPTAPKVNKVTSTTTKVTGKAEAGATVVIKVGTKVIGTAIANKNGNFTVSIAKQKTGTILYVTAKDKAGNVSMVSKVTVSK